MDPRNTELQRLKRRSDRMKRKYVTGWKITTIILLVFALLLTPVCVVATVFDNELAYEIGGSFWKLINPAPDTYTAEALDAQILLQAQTEGIVLLKNENGALPLSGDTKIGCVDGDTTDGEDLESLKGALFTMGFDVTATAGADTYDAAVVLLSRQEDQININVLTQPEKECLQGLADRKSAGKIQKIILLLDTANVMRLDELNDYGVDAIVWIGGAGGTAVAKVLTGVSPAGSLVDTWSHYTPNGQMGIYNGYKYYETRYEDFVMSTGNAGNFNYAEQVAHPFGFGLGYTEFAYSDMKTEYDLAADRFTVSVTVTNSGNVPGKETVQVYAQTPYTDYDKANGIEKPAVSLVGFGKTGELTPGASETVTVYVERRDLAAYDAAGAGTYILDAGNYYLTCATDAHNAVNNILAAKGYNPENTENRMDGEGNAALTYTWQENTLDTKTYAVSKSGAAITNIFPVTKDTCVSRQDWEGTLTRAGEGLNWAQPPYSPADHPDVAMPTMGAKNGLKLYDVVGLAYDDPKWQTLLDQLTFDDMLRLVTDGYGQILPVKSVGSAGAKKGEDGFPVREIRLAATFDPALMKAVGTYMGNAALSKDTQILQIPMDNYEDSFLAGSLRSALVQGLGEKGVSAVLEIDGGKAIYNEQSVREGDWRQYQGVLEENPTAGITGNLPVALVQEWGNHGAWTAKERPTAEGILSGVTSYGVTTMGALTQYESDPVIVTALRQACHRNLYVVANSAAMNGIGGDTTVQVGQLPAVTGLWIALAVCVALTVVFEFLWLRGRKKWQKTAEYLDYRTMKNTLQSEKKER